MRVVRSCFASHIILFILKIFIMTKLYYNLLRMGVFINCIAHTMPFNTRAIS